MLDQRINQANPVQWFMCAHQIVLPVEYFLILILLYHINSSKGGEASYAHTADKKMPG